ncbi:MAG: hypothetical protein II943_09835 [Victivallales bacterium]|nr:hypothetical protein [Victivallales bacterium]
MLRLTPLPATRLRGHHEKPSVQPKASLKESASLWHPDLAQFHSGTPATPVHRPYHTILAEGIQVKTPWMNSRGF